MVANKALGSTTGASNLELYIGYSAPAVATPNSVGGGSLGLQVPAKNRTIFGLSAIIQGLAPGDYQMGLAGSSSTAAQWNLNEYGYVTAIVFE